MPEMGDIRVWTGTGWTALTARAGHPALDPETVGMPPRFPDDIGDGGPDEDDLIDTTELLEVLLCPECEFELGCPSPCGARHLYLADNPLEHRLLRPLVEQYLRSLSTDRLCHACGQAGVDVQIARGTCTHVLIREGQVTMARSMWEGMLDELIDMRAAARESSPS